MSSSRYEFDAAVQDFKNTNRFKPALVVGEQLPCKRDRTHNPYDSLAVAVTKIPRLIETLQLGIGRGNLATPSITHVQHYKNDLCAIKKTSILPTSNLRTCRLSTCVRYLLNDIVSFAT